MPVTALVKLQVKPDQINNFRPLFAALLHETRSREGNEGVKDHQDLEGPFQVPPIKKWDHRQTYETYN